MPPLFITAPGIKSENWLTAFPSAKIINADELPGLMLDSESIVWIVLEGEWRESLKYALAENAKVIALSLTEDVREARALLSVGVKGYLQAYADKELLTRVHGVVESGGAWLGAGLLQQLLVNIDTPEVKPKGPVEGLTERENAVAACIAAGKSNKEVAEELDITERTVKAHLSACFHKLNVRDRVQLALAINK